MAIRNMLKRVLPEVALKKIQKNLTIPSRPSRARKESNRWLRHHCRDIRGHVLSIGSGNDSDGEGDFYRNYFPDAQSYTTSEVSEGFGCDRVIDIRNMPEIADASYDCIYCSGVLEHVDNYQAGFRELTRILKTDGILLLGLPFRQGLHMAPYDFWRFTRHGIEYMLKEAYEIISLVAIDKRYGADLPATYWVKARKSASC